MSLTVPTYIRTLDTEKYLAIQSQGRGAWTEFIHNALNPGFESLRSIIDDSTVETQVPAENVHKTNHSGLRLCKHGSDPSLCKFAKPGKPCK